MIWGFTNGFVLGAEKKADAAKRVLPLCSFHRPSHLLASGDDDKYEFEYYGNDTIVVKCERRKFRYYEALPQQPN